MAQHLCIVARNQPLLLGYLNIAFEHLSANGSELQFIIDRRPDRLQESAPPPQTTIPEQRHVDGVDELLHSQGYAIVSREAGMSWQLNEGGQKDGGQKSAEELVAVYDPAEEAATRAPGRHRTLLSALALTAAVVGVAVALPRDSVHRLADGLAGVADRGRSWLSASVDVPRTAPSTAPAATGGATSPPRPAPEATQVPPPPAAAALQSVPAAERPQIAPPRSEPPRAVEPSPRVAEPRRAVEPPRVVERPRVAEPPRAVKPAPRAVASAPRAATPPPAVVPAPAPAPRAEQPPKQSTARVVSAVPSGEDATSAGTPRAAEFAGLPRFEMTRERDAAGRTAAITVRVTDSAGRPLPTADVRIRRQFVDGAVRETQLQATAPEGSYRGPLPNTGPNTNGLVMRILLGSLRYEVPLAE
jgi:hypothetical protein